MSRYISIAEQDSWDTPLSGSSNQVFFDFASEDISPENNQLMYETAATRHPPGATLGPYRSTGSVDTFVETDRVGTMLKMAFGQVDTASAATYTHTFEPVSAEGNFPYFTMLINSDYPTGHRMVKNAGITSLELEGTAGELVSMNFDVLGAEEIDPDNNAPSADYSDIPYLSFQHGSIVISGADKAYEKSGVIESYSFSMDNDIPDDALVLGRRDLPGLRLQGLEVTGSLDLTFGSDEDWDMYQRFMGGTSGRQTPGDNAKDIQLRFKHYLSSSQVGTDIMSADHELNLYMPNVRLDSTNANLDTRDRIVQTVEFTAVDGNVSLDGTDYSNSIIAQLVNETSGY